MSSWHLVLSLLCQEKIPRNLHQWSYLWPWFFQPREFFLFTGCAYTLYFLLPDFPWAYVSRIQRSKLFKGKSRRTPPCFSLISHPLTMTVSYPKGRRATGERKHRNEVWISLHNSSRSKFSFNHLKWFIIYWINKTFRISPLRLLFISLRIFAFTVF